MNTESINVVWFYNAKSARWMVRVGDSDPITTEEFWDKYGVEVSDDFSPTNTKEI